MRVFSCIICRYGVIAPDRRLRSKSFLPSRQASPFLALNKRVSISVLEAMWQDGECWGITIPLATYISTIGNEGLSAYASPRFSSRSLIADNEHSTTTTSPRTRRQITSPWSASISLGEQGNENGCPYRISWTYLCRQSKATPLGSRVDCLLLAAMVGRVDKNALAAVCGREKQKEGKGTTRVQNSQWYR